MKMEILGIKIDNIDIEEALLRVEEFLGERRQHYIVTPNPEFLVRARRDREFFEILNKADLSVPDGVGLVFASHFLKRPIRQRIAGVDLMDLICQKAAQKNWPVFLLGGENRAAEKAAGKLGRKYPGLRIKALAEDLVEGFERGKELKVADMKVSSLPILPMKSILFVALGAPKQEKWIARNLKKIPSVRLAMGVGGAFDFISGRLPRAPRSWREKGLEWLWRLICQPWRIGRIFRAVVVFPCLVIWERMRGK